MNDIDVGWLPTVPQGHTAYSFKRSAKYATPQQKVKSVKLPVQGKRNILVTSALPYVNNTPHLGNLIGCVLSADVYARFCRLRDHNVIYVCGTDEYGTTTEKKAKEAKMTPQQICDKFHAIHKGVYDWFNIEFDQFGRTTNDYQTDICQGIFNDLDKAGHIVEDDLKQLYCASCDMYLADRYVKGDCPKCKAPGAYGDQCESCTTLISAVELINPICTTCTSVPVVKTKRHLFLDLPHLQPELEKWVEDATTGENEGKWSQNSINETNRWTREGLLNRCITRDLKWGTPVPKPGFTDKVFYVWFDAPIGYISITAEYTKDWKKWWQPDKDSKVELTQFMGKDNIPFHCVIFPSSLIGTRNEDWIKLNRISTTEYLNYENSKFSKSAGTGIFGDQAQDTCIPVAVWRYYLLAVRPELSDSVFTWDDLQARNNNELLKNIGNFVNRSFSLTKKYFNGKLAALDASKVTDSDQKFATEVTELVQGYLHSLEAISIKKGLKAFMSVASRGNLYLQTEQPWKVYKTDPARAGNIIYNALCLCKLLSALANPYMPSVSATILKQLNIQAEKIPFAGPIADYKFTPDLPTDGTHDIGETVLLFKELSTDEIDALKIKFGGLAEAKEVPFPLQLVTGVVTKAEPHPDAAREDSLVLQVQIAKPVDAAAVAAAAAAAKPALTPEQEAKAQAIAAAGALVKKLKTENAEKKLVDEAVAALLALKGPAPAKKKRGGRKKNKVLPSSYQVVSPISSSYTPEELVGKTVVLLLNVKTINVKKLRSEAHLLTATALKTKGKGNAEAKAAAAAIHVVSVPDGTPFGLPVLPTGHFLNVQKNFDLQGKLAKLKLCSDATGAIVVNEQRLLAKGKEEGAEPVQCIVDKFDPNTPVFVQK